MSKSIVIWGSKDTGKTVFSIKLANELSKKGNVLLVFADNTAPPMESFILNIESGGGSLGGLLSSEIISQNQILNHCSLIKGHNKMSCLGYKQGESFGTYANYTKERANDVLLNISHLVDFVVIDISSDFVSDEFSKSAMEQADFKIRFCGSTVKDISYFKSILPLVSSHTYKNDKDICILTKTDETSPMKVLMNYYGNIMFNIPYTKEVRKQLAEGELLSELVSKQSKDYNAVLEATIRLVTSDSEEEIKPKVSIVKNFISKKRRVKKDNGKK